MRRHPARPHPSVDPQLPPGAGGRRPRRAAWIAVAAGVACAMGSGTAVAAEAPDAELRLAGTVLVVLPDQVDAAGDAVPAEVQTLVEVDGVLHDLTGHPEVDGTASGTDVVLTLAADRGVTADAALAAVAGAAEGTAAGVDARLVDVTAVDAVPVRTGTEAQAHDDVVVGHDRDHALVDDAVVAGEHTLTILPVYGTAPDAQTRESLTARAEGVGRYWEEQSGGRLTFRSTARDWVEIDEPATCDSTAIWNRALAAHGRPTVSATHHVAVYFPHRDCGGWAGRATIGGGQIWINGIPTEDVLAHELGHNLGLGHAGTMTCGTGSAQVTLRTTGCAENAYGDRADVMGIATSLRSGNLTTAAADVLGLATVHRVTGTSVTTPVTVDLAPLAQVDATRAVALPVPGIAGGRLYVDFRPRVGRDVRQPAWAGVQVHLRKNDSRGVPQTYLLDMDPAAPGEFARPALAGGRSWTVPGTDLTVAVVSVGTKARVTVSSTPASPVTPPPAVTPPVAAPPAEAAPPVAPPVTPPADVTAPTRAVVTSPVAGAVSAGATTVRWQPSTDAVGVTGYDVVVDGTVVRRVGATVTSLAIGTPSPGRHTVAVDAVDAAGNRASGSPVAFTAVADETERYVVRVYRDLFGRAPDAAGLAGWSRALNSGTPRGAVANAITSSEEYRGRLIQDSYLRYLGRGADPHGRASWLRAMGRGLTIQGMEAGFLASPEYYDKAGSTNARWVTRLYQHVLGRTPSAGEVAGWGRVLAGGAGRHDVALGFLLSTEHLTTVVDGHYRHLLGRGIDPVGAASWVASIQRGTRVESIVGGIVASGEYVGRR